MRLGRLQRRCVSYVAMLAMALLVLAPTFSRALAGDVEPGLLAICTSGSGLASDPGSAPPDSGLGHLGEHCPFCLLHAAFAVAPTVAASVPRPAAGPLPRADSAAAAPACALPWTSTGPRGPPHSS